MTLKTKPRPQAAYRQAREDEKNARLTALVESMRHAPPQRGVIRRVDEAIKPPPARPVQPKAERWESVPWRRAVASLPCVLCNKQGDTQAAHRNEGKGMGLKTDDSLTAALCTTCHTEIDQGAHLSREQRRERMDRAILLTVQALARAGRLRTVEPA